MGMRCDTLRRRVSTQERKANRIYEGWVLAAGGKIKGKTNSSSTTGASASDEPIDEDQMHM